MRFKSKKEKQTDQSVKENFKSASWIPIAIMVGDDSWGQNSTWKGEVHKGAYCDSCPHLHPTKEEAFECAVLESAKRNEEKSWYPSSIKLKVYCGPGSDGELNHEAL